MVNLKDIKPRIGGKVVGFATTNWDDGNPHNIAVEINKIEKDNIVITDNAMNKTLKNIKKSPNISIVFWDNFGGVRVDGIADYQTEGKLFDYVKALETNKDYTPKGVVE